MLRHVSVLGPSSGSCIVLAKVTLLKVTLISLFQLGIMVGFRVVLCCVVKSALLRMCVRTSVTGHMLPQYPTGIVKLM